jgi:hypothetical protein
MRRLTRTHPVSAAWAIMSVVISDPLPLVDLLETGAAIMVATRDAELRTHVTRGWGGYLDAETGHLSLALTDYPGSGVIPDLEANRLIAVSLARPVNYQSMQLKGVVASIADCTTEEQARVNAHVARFVEETVSVGGPRTIARIAGSQFIQVRVAIDHSYEQTPGPDAAAGLR